jgi:alpha-beta hydrolase superfamily lysophospholipase
MPRAYEHDNKFAPRIPILIDRYRKAGVPDISHDFYQGGRHEMLNEINREEVRRNLLVWLSPALRIQSHQSEAVWPR